MQECLGSKREPPLGTRGEISTENREAMQTGKFLPMQTRGTSLGQGQGQHPVTLKRDEGPLKEG